jgi:hypothetical protein
MIKNKLLKFFNRKSFLIIFVLIFCIISSLIYAGISINPTKKEIELSRGEFYRDYFLVNVSTGDFDTVSVSARVWQEMEQNKDIKIDQWLKIDNTDFKITKKNKGQIEVWYNVSVPTNTLGEIAAMISFTPRNTKINNSSLTQIYSVPLYVFIKGTMSLKAEVEKFEINLNNNKTFCVAYLKNEGNVHFRPKTKFVFYKKKKQVLEVNLNTGWPVYANSTRFFKGESEHLLKKGKYKLEILVYNETGTLIAKKKYNLKIKNNKVVKNDEIKEKNY